MTTKPNTAAHFPTGPEPSAPSASGARAGRQGRKFGAAVLGVAALATVGALAGGTVSRADATVLTNCAASPSRCGFPDATNTGVPTGTTLKPVPGQVSSGPGWHWNATYGEVIVTGNGTVLSGLYIPGTLDIEASNVTVKNDQIVTGGAFGISLRHTTGVTIENSTISGQNATTGRVDAAISDVYCDSTGMVIEDNNISDFRIGIQIPTGLVKGNYIHDPGYVSGDHTNGIMAVGTTEPMTIENNTVFNDLGQTDAITLNASGSGQAVANKTVVGNLLAGGGYVIYGGAAHSDPTSNIVIEGNRFSQIYYPKSGYYGPDAYFDSTGTGNVWSGNVWDATGTAVSS
jgi:hypothetical protein